MEDTFHLGIKALIRNNENQILLLKVNPKALKKYTGEAYWDIPGGRIERNSSVEDTLVREINEEISVSDISDVVPVDMVLSNIRIPVGDTDVGLILGIYSCKIPVNSKIVLSDEHIDYSWFNPSEAARLLEVKYPKEFIAKIKV